MDRTIIHVDMDAFFAAVEVLDRPELGGKPLIIGALPHERGVVSTCSYEARIFGVRSAMSIKEAYRLCPQGIYMHPNPHKYKAASDRIHRIWLTYTDAVEYISLDEGFLDVTGTAHLFGSARQIGLAIKKRTKEETGLTCSVGIGYSMMSAKLASEEKKPDGFFEIPDAPSLQRLIMDRNVRIIYGVGPRTAEALQRMDIHSVRDILTHRSAVLRQLGRHGQQIAHLAEGIDLREVIPYEKEDAKSFGKEVTFQRDTSNFRYLKDVLRLIAKELSLTMRLDGVYARTVTLKVKYGNMQLVTRAKSGEGVNRAREIYQRAATLLDTLDKRPVRLVGITLGGFSESEAIQLTMENPGMLEKKDALDRVLLSLERRYGGSVIKTGEELMAEKRLETEATEEDE